jgi:energy-coupling factor transporter ATP-binding protein EcfA2
MKIGGRTLTCNIKLDDISKNLASAFDYSFDGSSAFELPVVSVPDEYAIGLIVGPSGSGKSSLLAEIGDAVTPRWEHGVSIASHFSSDLDAKEKLGAAGLNSVPAMLLPYDRLSNGQKFRADIARMLNSNAVIDEFTSVVDRQVAKSCSWAIQRYIRDKGLRNITFSSCHYDVIDWLNPDWVFDTESNSLGFRGSVRRPEIEIKLYQADSRVWGLFRSHHYLSADINKSARCWLAMWDGKPVGFTSVIAFPSGTIKNAWREHRTVILPDFQGLGIGVRISDAVGAIITSEGGRFFSKTSSYRMGEYRNSSPSWRPTSKNGMARKDYLSNRKTKESGYKHRHVERICYSHEYTKRGHHGNSN